MQDGVNDQSCSREVFRSVVTGKDCNRLKTNPKWLIYNALLRDCIIRNWLTDFLDNSVGLISEISERYQLGPLIFSTKKLGSLKAVANEDTLLRTHCCRHKCFPVCLRVQHLLRTQILCLCSETFCVCNKCFPVCAAQETSWTTMCPQQCVLVCQGLKKTTTATAMGT